MSIVGTSPFPTCDAEEDIRRALDAEASGYVLKDSSQDDLMTALLAVHRGEPWLPANLARSLRKHTQQASSLQEKLNARHPRPGVAFFPR